MDAEGVHAGGDAADGDEGRGAVGRAGHQTRRGPASRMGGHQVAWRRDGACSCHGSSRRSCGGHVGGHDHAGRREASSSAAAAAAAGALLSLGASRATRRPSLGDEFEVARAVGGQTAVRVEHRGWLVAVLLQVQLETVAVLGGVRAVRASILVDVGVRLHVAVQHGLVHA